ncbi:MAG: LysM peptidoglycan-binding domain-containing protein [Planctomycetia bacterium]|nr:LysM peptidoglycan-binding domain-containing protein [Planctomycetia bacterium]
MGKETKIGLAVIGVLLLGFGALLIRRLIVSDVAGVGEPDAPRAAQAFPSAAEGKPTVVTAQRESAEQLRALNGKNPWKARGEDMSAESIGDVPRASYLPAENPPRDRYTSESEPVADDLDRAQPLHRAGSNPFGSSLPEAGNNGQEEAAPPNRLETDAQEATPIEPPSEPPKRRARNPLRRTSAQFPLNGADSAAATPNELNENDAQSAQNVGPSDVATAEPTSALPRDEDAPTAVAADSSIQAAASDPAAQPRSAWGGAVEPVSNNAVEPLPLENGKYTVQPNDSLWTVSEKVYGTGRYFKAIYEHNRARLPHADRLAVGTVIAVPPVAVLEQNYPSLCPKQRKSALVKPRTIEASTRQRIAGSNLYVVEEGDTLFDIARYELGKASRWAEIYDLNRDALGEDFDYLQPGTELTMPSRTQAADSVTRQRDAGIQR